ncbi:hypothetical protein [Candidatus Electronema sp. JC]|uniref:hypothetical protein n=1 Tax=Candidatus Electronema sp. JC TaxID=3401570 RepID=UPI003B43C8A2
MAGNILISMALLILTAAAQRFCMPTKSWPSPAGREALRMVFLYVLPAVLLALACWQKKKIAVYKKRAWMADNPAPFSQDNIDCYVRFKGRVEEEKTLRLPLSGSECSFYTASVIAEWQTKQKKPGSGMETNRKEIFQERSADVLWMTDRNVRVHVYVDDFSKTRMAVRRNEKSSSSCPREAQEKADSKYTTYHLVEQYISHGDRVIAQGRLALSKDGRLFIKPTGRLEFPSFIAVQQQASQIIQDIVDQADSRAWNRRIRVAALLVNAGLFVYFWL